MEELVEIVVIQNFIRLGVVIDISNYKIYSDKIKLFEYLVMIAFIEVGTSRPFEFWKIWELRKNEENLGNLAVEMLTKSSKCRKLIPLLKRYYFEDSSILSTSNIWDKWNGELENNTKIIRIVEKAFEDFGNNSALKLALMGHVKLLLSEDKMLYNSVISEKFYSSVRKPLLKYPIIYHSNDETLLVETCIFWMYIEDNNKKSIIINNSIKIAKMISNDI